MEKLWKYRISCPVQERKYDKVNATHYIDSDEIMNCDNGLNMYNFNKNKNIDHFNIFPTLLLLDEKNMNPV